VRIVILGGGHVGSLIARRLLREGNEVTIVELSEERCIELENALDAKVIHGSAASISALDRAGISDADMLIAVTENDEANILGCLIAQCNSSVKIKLLRLRTHEVDLWRKICDKDMLHIDYVIHPDRETAARILKALDSPGVSEIHDFADGKVKLFGMNIEFSNFLSGQSVAQILLNVPQLHLSIPMIFRGNAAFIPRPDEIVRGGDHIYILTPSAELDDAFAALGVPPRKKIERIFIVGGKQLGIELASRLESSGVHVKLFEQNIQRCEFISSLVKQSVVVHGDGTDQQILFEENIKGIDAYLAMTEDDEDNIIASLLARKLGARKSIALVNRPELLSMAQTLGINSIFNSRLVTVDKILHYVRKGQVLSITTFRNEEIEAIELLATARSKYVGKKLGSLKLPRGGSIGAIVRSSAEVIIPTEDSSIQEGDRVIFFCLEQSVPHLESAFTAEKPGTPL
jgi:trk system potassium uptake protein TrkA